MNNSDMTNAGQETASPTTLLTGDNSESGQSVETVQSDTFVSAGEENGEATQAAKPEQPTESEIPDSYDLKTPAGVELDAAFLEQATPLLQELKLSAPQAQKLADLYAEKVTGMRQAQMDAWSKTIDAWQTSARNDAEYGGATFAQNVGLAQTALKKFGTPELNRALVDQGIGNHPEFIRLMYRVGKAMQEDGLMSGERSSGPMDPGKVLYPNMA